MYWLDPDTSFKLNVFCHLEMSLESPFSDVSLRNPNIAQVFLSQYLNSWTCLTDKAWPILPFSPLESERNDISRFENGDCTRTRSRVPWLFRVQPKHQKRLSPDADNRKYAPTRLRKPIDMELDNEEVVCAAKVFGYQLDKSDEVMTAFLSDFEFEMLDDKVKMVQKGNSKPAAGQIWLGTCNRNMTLTAWWVGEMS